MQTNTYGAKWISYKEMTILQKINLKANALQAHIKYQHKLDALLIELATSDFKHDPDSYNTPFRFIKYK